MSARNSLPSVFIATLPLLAAFWLIRRGRSRAAAVLEKYIAADPYQDDIHCQLIEEHLALGDELSASRAYKRFHEKVARELDSPPSSRMVALRRRLATTRQS